MEEQMKRKNENDILYSKTVKAGKRVYYVDVKKDRYGEFYLSITESKRIFSGEDDGHPVFEKHKIFLYREDIDKFAEAFTAAADYASKEASRSGLANEYFSDGRFRPTPTPPPETALKTTLNANPQATSDWTSTSDPSCAAPARRLARDRGRCSCHPHSCRLINKTCNCFYNPHVCTIFAPELRQ